MGALIGEVIEGIVIGIKGAVDRAKLGDAFIDIGEKIKRGDVVSDEAVEKAKATLERMRSVRDQYKDD